MGLVGCIWLSSAGCGGSGGSSTPSPFAGTWVGTWNAPSIPDSGTTNVTIDTNGQITGSTHDNNSGTNGTFTGSITNAGALSATVSYPGTANSSVTGTGSIASNGHLLGNAIQVQGGVQVGLTEDLTKQ
ncbi:MAG TPA: hypothetical protein VKT78_19800 [Fimbriimonadaceae bacterium]|nr:hypothetical protein [Fimbriimonadaceae bacterium]